MAHDGQNMTSSATVVLPDLLNVSSKSLVKLEELFNVGLGNFAITERRDSCPDD